MTPRTGALGLGVLTAMAVCAFPAHAQNKCVLQRVAEMPVTMAGTRPLISGTINGAPARFLADSGAFFSILSREAADRYGIRVGPLPPQIRVRGTGGAASVKLGKAAKFSLEGFAGGREYQNVDFLVGANTFARDTAGIIGQNIIGTVDAEYDLANGFIRLFRTKDCGDAMLAYWAKDMSVAQLEFEPRSPGKPHIIGDAKLNGKKIRVMFDTGASTSVLTLRAAAKAGIKPENDDVTAAGISQGLGKRTNENWLGRFDTFDIGGELIKNARLRMADISLDSADMLLGADFFLSHRIYVATVDRKIYFSYNGGPVFDLRQSTSSAEPATLTDASTDAAAAADAEVPLPPEDIDADDLRRRGAASAGRRDFRAALADLDRAIKLDATDPENYHQRGIANWQNGRPRIALADFDAALGLKPDHVPTLLSRGALRLALKNKDGAIADLDAAEKLSPKDADVPLRSASILQSFGDFDAAIARYDAWEKAHPKDDRLPGMLSNRCWARSRAQRELDLALADCNLALRKGLRNSTVYDTRAYVHLLQDHFDAAIEDYDAALELQPKKALSLYGRGIARTRKGAKAEGEADIKAALELDPNIAQAYRRAGLGATL